MNIWWLATSKNEGHCSYDELKNRKILAQGWSAIGDISALLPVKNENDFKKIINNLVVYVYDGWKDERDPGRVILNLLKISKGDFILCTEGESIKGIAKVVVHPQYRDDNGSGQYEYAQTIYPVTDWKDWDFQKAGNPPPVKSMGPVGINYYGGDKQVVLDAWNKLF